MPDQPRKHRQPASRGHWKKWLRRTLVAFGLVLLVAVSFAWWIGGRLLESANRTIQQPKTSLSFQDVSIPRSTGGNVASWLAVAPKSRGVVILAHPIRGSRLSMVERAEFLFSEGYSTLLIDLQAHGETTGERITLGHLECRDVGAAVAYAKQRFPDQPVGVVGWSLGGAAALLECGRIPEREKLDVDALVLESVYPDVKRAIHNRLGMRIGALRHVVAPLLLAQLKPRLGVSAGDLRPIDSIARTECPTLILAGSDDAHTTLAESKDLYDAARHPKEFVTFDGAKHQDLHRYDSEKYQRAVTDFLATAMVISTDETQSPDR